MSVQAINWAFNQSLESSSCKFILVCLANYANENSEAYPSVETISRMTNLDRKTIISGLGKLCSSGHIEDTGKRVGFTKAIPVYKLSQKRNDTENGTVPKTDESSPVFPNKQSRFSAKQSQKRDTEPSVTVIEPSGEGSDKPLKFATAIAGQLKTVERLIEKNKMKYPRKESDDVALKELVKRKNVLMNEHAYADQ